MSRDTWEKKRRSGVLLSSLIELLFDTILSTTCVGRSTHVCFHPQISCGAICTSFESHMPHKVQYSIQLEPDHII